MQKAAEYIKINDERLIIGTNLLLKIQGILSGYSKTGSSNLIEIRFFIFPPYFEYNNVILNNSLNTKIVLQ